MRMNELAARIIGWANDRNLVLGSTVDKQNVKLVEEFGELAAGIARNKLEVQADALGDIMVILIILGAQSGESILSGISKNLSRSHLDYDEVVHELKGLYVENGKTLEQEPVFRIMARDIGALVYGGATAKSLACPMWGTIMMCFTLGLEPAKVLEDVWNIIKDRKGKMVDGVFIKENDAMMSGGSNQQA